MACRNTYTYRPSETTWNGAAAANRAVVDRNGSVSSWRTTWPGGTATVLPLRTVGTVAWSATPKPTEAISAAKVSGRGLGDQWSASTMLMDPPAPKSSTV